MMPYLTVSLTREHDRGGFDCGVEALNVYLKQYARQDRDRNLAQVYVHCAPDVAQVIAFYTLHAFAVRRTDLPEPAARRLGRQDLVPAVLIGRLAVDLRHRGQGLGGHLLIDALRRARDASLVAAAAVVVVDAKEGATGFYRRHGFLPFADQADRLFLPLATVAETLRQAGLG